MMLARVDDWQSRVIEVVDRYRREPFAWGSADCVGFAADCIQAVTGVDVLGRWRGKYDCRQRAAALLMSRGYRTVGEAVDSTLAMYGCEPIPVWAARVGDIGITSEGVVCVRMPPGFVARDEGRMMYVVTPEKAWRIG